VSLDYQPKENKAPAIKNVASVAEHDITPAEMDLINNFSTTVKRVQDTGAPILGNTLLTVSFLAALKKGPLN
jgi:hypothetical protein